MVTPLTRCPPMAQTRLSRSTTSTVHLSPVWSHLLSLSSAPIKFTRLTTLEARSPLATIHTHLCDARPGDPVGRREQHVEEQARHHRGRRPRHARHCHHRTRSHSPSANNAQMLSYGICHWLSYIWQYEVSPAGRKAYNKGTHQPPCYTYTRCVASTGEAVHTNRVRYNPNPYDAPTAALRLSMRWTKSSTFEEAHRSSPLSEYSGEVRPPGLRALSHVSQAIPCPCHVCSGLMRRRKGPPEAS